MRKVISCSLLVVIILFSSIGVAKGEWKLEIMGGAPYNLETPLHIEQDQGDIDLENAQYDSKPFVNPIYYSLRLSNWQENKAWELEMIHQKLYLNNKPKEVQNFEISHGYNLLTINRAWKRDSLIYHLGAGVVLAHPKTTIRNKTLFDEGGILETGYYLAGPTIEAAVGKEISITDKIFMVTEGKLTSSYATIPIEDGTARVPNFALHGVIGLGYQF